MDGNKIRTVGIYRIVGIYEILQELIISYIFQN